AATPYSATREFLASPEYRKPPSGNGLAPRRSRTLFSMPPAFTSRVMNILSARSTSLARLLILSAGVWSCIAFDATTTFGQTPTPLLTSRDELSAAVTRAEQSGNAAQAAAI